LIEAGGNDIRKARGHCGARGARNVLDFGRVAITATPAAAVTAR
jgi:hypothetical protein